MTELDGQSQGSAEVSSSSTSMVCQVQEMPTSEWSNSPSPCEKEYSEKKGMCNENFEKLLLGEDMWGFGNEVPAALTISQCHQ